MSSVSQAISDENMNVRGHESQKCVRRSGQFRLHIFAFSKLSPDSSCVQDSSVRKLESDGQSVVTVCPSTRANAYPSPVEPV